MTGRGEEKTPGMASGGEDEEKKIGMAAGGISEEEMGLLNLLRTFKIKPTIKSPDDIALLAEVLDPDPEHRRKAHHDVTPRATVAVHQYPKFSIFFGEEGKGEVNWDTFRYEVEAMVTAGTFTDEQVMFGIRRSLKGIASDKVRRLGSGVTPNQVLEKLHCDYGTVLSKETFLKKLYTCEQKTSECVETFASRLEDIFYKAAELGAFNPLDTTTLKQVLHNGLRTDLKQMSVYQYEKTSTYDDFKKELRRLEADLKPSSEDKKPCKPAMNTEKKENSETTQFLKQLNERMERLEKAQTQGQDREPERQQWYGRRSFPRGRYRGNYRGMDRGRGRGDYRPQRPLASDTFSPTCYICKKKGHIQTACPTIVEYLVCTKCREKGHFRKDCPN